jgi:hypothetical protein
MRSRIDASRTCIGTSGGTWSFGRGFSKRGATSRQKAT